MTKTQTKLTPKQKAKLLMPLIARGAEVDASIKELQSELLAIKGDIAAYEPDYTDYLAPGAELNVKPHRVLNKSRAERIYGDAVKELVVTPNAVRARLGDDAKSISELYDESYAFSFRYVGEQ